MFMRLLGLTLINLLIGAMESTAVAKRCEYLGMTVSKQPLPETVGRKSLTEVMRALVNTPPLPLASITPKRIVKKARAKPQVKRPKN